MNQPAYYKRTFYAGLREYPEINGYKPKRGGSYMNNSTERIGDVFTQSQNHWNPGFRKEQSLVKNYQKQMDIRLSNPKRLTKILTRDDSKEKIFRNTCFEDQNAHQNVFCNSTSKAENRGRLATLLNAGSRTMKSDLKIKQ